MEEVKWKLIDFWDSFLENWPIWLFLLFLLYVVLISPLANLFFSRNISTEILISDKKYEVGDTGTITIELLNNTSKDIKPFAVILSLPTNFLSGFIVDHPDSCSLNQGVMGFGQTIRCNEIIIPANKSVTLVFTITPYQEGNYGGNITAKAYFGKSLFLITSKESFTLNISVLPK